jgi:hypothetical protein
MRVVIDSNRVRSLELRQFLAAKATNKAVVTDWLMMEGYKAEAFGTLRDNLEVLGDFPQQVIVIKNTGMCMKVKPAPQMWKKLVWTEHTDTFTQFVDGVRFSKYRNSLIGQAIQERAQIAMKRMEELESRAAIIMGPHQAALELLASEDIDLIRGKESKANGFGRKIVSIVLLIAASYRQELGLRPLASNSNAIRGDFILRVAVAHTADFIQWIQSGRNTSKRPSKVRNDYVDMMLSVYGTYFNGVMSGDTGLLEKLCLQRVLLSLFSVSTPSSYQNGTGDL